MRSNSAPKLVRIDHLERARPRQVDRNHFLDAAGPRGHHHHLVAEQDRLLDRVGDEQHGLMCLVENLQQFLLHHDLGLRVERGERLVHQQDRPLHDQRARQRHALAHAAGKLPRQVALEAAQADRGEQRRGALIALGCGHAAHLEAEGDVVDDVAPRKQIEVLPDHDRVGAERPRHRPAARRWMRTVPLGRRLEAADDLDQRALAAAARAEQAGEPAGAETMGEAVQRHGPAWGPRPKSASRHRR